MQFSWARFTTNDLAKYPFLEEAAEYVKTLDFKIDDLANPELVQILERAQERLEEAILYLSVDRDLNKEDIEILSFPAAVILAAATKNSFIKKRYALAEAKQAYEQMIHEPPARSDSIILAVAQNFNWELAKNEDAEAPYAFRLHFADYLRNTARLRDKEWKLVNRILSKGNVFLTRKESARLLMEEVRKRIESRLDFPDLPKLPPKITDIAEKMVELTVERIGKHEVEGFPKTTVQAAFPPCIKALYKAVSSGHHLSHVGRFTLTSFLINIGMPVEDVIGLFKSFSDYNERMTRYQVEHIAGERGSRTRYTPPICDTLKTHGVCVNPDDICQKIIHPLTYYRRKLRLTDQEKSPLPAIK